MLFDMEKLEAQNRYKILASTVTPRPIAWVTTLSDDGVINAAPYSFSTRWAMSPRRSRSGFSPGRVVSRTRRPISLPPASSW